MKAFYIFLFLFNIIYALPIFPSSSSSSLAIISSSIISSTFKEQPKELDNINIYEQQERMIEEELIEDEEEVDYTPIIEDAIEEQLLQQQQQQQQTDDGSDSSSCPTTEYSIPVERFAQLVSTHWQFDHLDAIRSGAYKVISKQFQEHIQIHIEPISEKGQINEPSSRQQQQQQRSRQRSFSNALSNTWDMMMDLEILHAQIFGALQAHTEGSLHIAWDRLSDKLGQPAFEQFIRTVALQHCTLDPQQGSLSSTCLRDKATTISKELDEYINLNLNGVFVALEKEILPNLLANTSQDLKGVLDYFNRLFLLKDNQHLILQVSPWSEEDSDLQQQLQPLLYTSVDEHLQDFFENYSCFSRA